MNYPAPNPDISPVTELGTRITECVECGGSVVRHSLGGGQSVDRCMRCFRRYRRRGDLALAARKGRLRRMLDDFVTWRE